jgi:SAM-dependent methyltransferase
VLDVLKRHAIKSKNTILKTPFGKTKRNYAFEILRKLLTGSFFATKVFLYRGRGAYKAICAEGLLLTKEWPIFAGNPKSAVLCRRRAKEIKKIASYLNQVNMLDTVTKSTHSGRVARVLEVACGTGFSSLELANKGFEVVGLEVDVNLCKLLKGAAQYFRVNSAAVAGDACSIPFLGHAFDVVFSRSFFEHVHDRDAALKEQIRVLRKGGVLVIEDGNLFNPKSLFNLLFLYPLRSKGKLGGIKWLFNKRKIQENLYGYLPRGRDEDIKSLGWWKARIAREADLVPLEITTTAQYTHPWIPKPLRCFAGGCLVLARKK